MSEMKISYGIKNEFGCFLLIIIFSFIFAMLCIVPQLLSQEDYYPNP
jgi:hypothetical protein